PAVVDVATGQRLIYHGRYNSASSAGHITRNDSRWFGGQSPDIPRRFAGLTVVPASGPKKLLELAATGRWAYTRFGLVQMEWPLVRHSEFPELPRIRDEPGPEFSPQQFSHDGRFAMFADFQQRAAGEKYVGLVRPLDDVDAATIRLTTDHPQVWMDQHPVSGNFWLRIQVPAPEGTYDDPTMRLLEFDRQGKLLRDLRDFSDNAQERRYLKNGELICKDKNGLTIIRLR
ncbi:MAG: hypothetical protein ACR2NP_18065, partial [Pirellulaceae bacterium]